MKAVATRIALAVFAPGSASLLLCYSASLLHLRITSSDP